MKSQTQIASLLDSALEGVKSAMDDALDVGDYELAKRLTSLGDMLKRKKAVHSSNPDELLDREIWDALRGLEQFNRISEPLEELKQIGTRGSEAG